MKIKHALEMDSPQIWKYETDQKDGVCVIAKEPMVIKFTFEFYGDKFFDVLEIEQLIDEMLKEPVSVEGAAQELGDIFKDYEVTASGRSAGHGWITSIQQPI